MSEKTIPNDFTAAVKDIKLAILQARARAARVSNVEALKLYFYVGGYISKKTRNAKWGSGAIDALSERLQVELPGLRGFSAASIKYMRQFFEEWANWFEIRHLPSDESPSVLIRQLPIGKMSQETVDVMGAEDIDAFLSVGFTHHIRIFTKCKSLGDRLYYIRRCAREHMTVIQLERSLAANEHLHVGAISNNFAKTLSPMALANQAVRSFRDEYLLDLINLDNVDARYGYETDERVLSKTMVAEIEKTIAALGGDDFCFMAREKRLVFKEDEFFVDLLFFHRGLKSMVAIELKKGDFHPGYLGQLNFYLSALDKLMKKPDENPTIGLLLCETVNKPVVELAVQGYSQPIGIATYRALRNIPEPYKTLAPVIDGVRRVLVEHGKEKRKSLRRKAK
jgi:predicted nuclease of restriction endonuclease-like (RecB) superfamily